VPARSRTSETGSRRHELGFSAQEIPRGYSDIIVVGAGLAGSAAAWVLGRRGLQVLLIDPRDACPPVFKAEKIEPDQARALRNLGLLDLLLPVAQPIRKIHAYYNGRCFGTSHTQQFGSYYCDLVNAVRRQMPSCVYFKQERVAQIQNGTDLQRVKLSNHEELCCRLVVLACGLNSELPVSLGLRKIMVQKNQSLALGFNMARADAQPFHFDSLTYYSISRESGIDYISLFPVGRNIRANLFAFPKSDDPWVRHFIQAPEQGLRRWFPKLQPAIGEYRVTSPVQASIVHLYRIEGQPHGVVLIGDAAQNVCPSTGMGLNKILSDLEVLLQMIDDWLSSPGMSRDKLANFYNHPEKRAVDLKALRNAFYRRHATTGSSPKWRIHRIRLHLSMQFRRPTQMEPARS
jgi:2-polyprenyl-6-methoxyphenol hydroxylase-like FAD-dependent oxidoreductase